MGDKFGPPTCQTGTSTTTTTSTTGTTAPLTCSDKLSLAVCEGYVKKGLCSKKLVECERTCNKCKVECINENSTSFTAETKIFTATLDYRRPRAELADTLKQLKKHNWLDKNTIWLDIKYVVLNLDLETYTSVTLTFEF